VSEVAEEVDALASSAQQFDTQDVLKIAQHASSRRAPLMPSTVVFLECTDGGNRITSAGGAFISLPKAAAVPARSEAGI